MHSNLGRPRLDSFSGSTSGALSTISDKKSKRSIDFIHCFL